MFIASLHAQVHGSSAHTINCDETLVAIAVVLLVLFIIGAIIDNVGPLFQVRESTFSGPTDTQPLFPHPTRSEPSQPPFAEPPLRLPETGTVTRLHTTLAVAPLEISTRGGTGHYFVKLVDWQTKTPVLNVFIRDGQRVEILVPVGNYELRYAVGNTWYGSSHLFGPESLCARAEDAFLFIQTANGYEGYSVELYLQRDGNLHTEPISFDEF